MLVVLDFLLFLGELLKVKIFTIVLSAYLLHQFICLIRLLEAHQSATFQIVALRLVTILFNILLGIIKCELVLAQLQEHFCPFGTNKLTFIVLDSLRNELDSLFKISLCHSKVEPSINFSVSCIAELVIVLTKLTMVIESIVLILE